MPARWLGRPGTLPLIVLTALSLAMVGQAAAAEPVTVDGLLAEGYTVAAAVPSPIGPGLFLQKGPALYACFVAEKPGAPALTTVYCKPVH